MVEDNQWTVDHGLWTMTWNMMDHGYLLEVFSILYDKCWHVLKSHLVLAENLWGAFSGTISRELFWELFRAQKSSQKTTEKNKIYH